MKLLRNPFIGEGLTAIFSHPPVLRTYLYYIAVLALLAFFWWPRGQLADFFRNGAGPQTFAVAAIGLLTSIAYLNLRFGAEDFAVEDSTKVHDFVTLTPVPVATVVAGKLIASFLHVLVLLALGAPFLLACSGVSGVTPGALGLVLLIAGSTAIALRALGFFVFTILEARQLLKNGILLTIAAVWVFATMSFLPPASPVAAILSLDTGSYQGVGAISIIGATVPFYAISVIIDCLAILVFSSAAIVRLGIVRRQYLDRVPSAPRPVEALWKRSFDDERSDTHDGDDTGRDLSP